MSPSSAAASSHAACLRRIRLTSAAVPACSYASRASALCPLSSSSRATSSASHPLACSRFSTWPSRTFRLVSFVSASAASSSVPIAVSHSSCALSAASPGVPGQLQPALDVVGEVVAGTRRVARPVEQAASQRLLMDAWRAVLWRARSGSTGVVLLGSALGSFLPHVGSNSSIVDYRFVAPASPPNVAASFRETVALPVIEQMQELQAALSLKRA